MQFHSIEALVLDHIRAEMRAAHARHLRHSPTIGREQVAAIVIPQVRERFEKMAEESGREGQDAVADVLEAIADAVPEWTAQVLRTM